MPTQPEPASNGTLAVVVAAGRGTRAAATTATPGPAKQYQPLAGIPILARAIQPFLDHPGVDRVQVVIHPDDHALYEATILALPERITLLPPVHGGATRQQSVLNALRAHKDNPPARVLIHDAARPFVTNVIISDVLAVLETGPAAVPATALADTLQRATSDRRLIETLPRDNLWRAQTPQGFHFAPLLKAHEAAASDRNFDYTDDAAIAAAAGLVVQIVPADPANTKLTTAEDFHLAERLLATAALPDIRVGQGFDVHRFTSGDHVWLCGVKIDHTHGVDAHSDGDVGLHALTDALLGAIADGDIGQHFKNTDPRWKGKASSHFLADARDRVTNLGARITSVDVTILAEAPKIGPHRDHMRKTIADILSLDITRVGLKATTTETLGFTGRREGLAAMATATVIFPHALV